jgi:hypothetical protein
LSHRSRRIVRSWRAGQGGIPDIAHEFHLADRAPGLVELELRADRAAKPLSKIPSLR